MFSSSRITGIPASNSHLNHTYFNGAACVNICPFQPNTLNVFPQHITLPHINGNIFASVAVKAKLFNYQVQTLCTQSVIACGNNARQSVTINQYDNEMKIYPNPANDLINVTLAVNINEEYMAEIIDATGKVVQSEYVVLPEGESEVQFSISHLPQGIYTLRISDGKQQMHKTFVVN